MLVQLTWHLIRQYSVVYNPIARLGESACRVVLSNSQILLSKALYLASLAGGAYSQSWLNRMQLVHFGFSPEHF